VVKPITLSACIALQSSGDIDWKSYEKEVDPQVLKLFKDSFNCKSFAVHGVALDCLYLLIMSAQDLISLTAVSLAALDFPMYDAGALAKEAFRHHQTG